LELTDDIHNKKGGPGGKIELGERHKGKEEHLFTARFLVEKAVSDEDMVDRVRRKMVGVGDLRMRVVGRFALPLEGTRRIGHGACFPEREERKG
jgi:hypothetical protein